MKVATKEEVYDEKINPLMAEVLAICKEHKIAMVASFSIPNEEDPDLHCSSCLLEDEFEPSEPLMRAWAEINRQPQVFAFTVRSQP